MKKFYLLFVVLMGLSVYAQNPTDIVNIPDANFKAMLVTSSTASSIAKNINGNFIIVDTNNDDEIQVSEALAVYSIYINDTPVISNMEGIQSFTNLKHINLLLTAIVTIDLTGLTNLETFSAFSVNISNLTVAGLSNLTELSFTGTSISSIDLTGLSSLEKLICMGNSLTSLDLTGLTNLKEIKCNINEIGALNIAGLTNLKYLDCSSNNITELDVSGSPLLELLDCSVNPITTLNVSGLSNLKYLYFNQCPVSSIATQGLNSLEDLQGFMTNLTSLDVSNLSNLKYLSVFDGDIATLNLSGATALSTIECSNNQISSLNLSGMTKLISLYCINNQLTTLDLSDLIKLINFSANGNQLESLYLKNGKTENISSYDLGLNPNLHYICADEAQIESLQTIVTGLGYNCEINSYCSFTPGGVYYTVSGSNSFDADNNGCGDADASFPNFKFNIASGTTTGSVIANQSGEYSISVQAGTHTIIPVIENPTYFNVSPTTASVTFTSISSPFTQNFCVTPNGFHQDLDVTIIPLNPAVPGFNAQYKIIYRNIGNVNIAMGTVGLDYEDATLDYVSSIPSTEILPVGNLYWTFLNLQPFETRTIEVTFNLNSPMETPALNSGDLLAFEASVDTSVGEDTNPIDNVIPLQQTVVNSFDPNDKTCLEGTSITPDMIGKYVHYMIRFENTGTFAAQNIVVKDMIDATKFDVASLIPLNASHDYVTRIAGNKVEFIFENINLPFDNATNDGYIVFKIKTLPTLVLGDSFSNSASIYFDYNFPIVTDPAVTTFAVLSSEDFVFNNYLTVYPNPTKDILNITSKQSIKLKSMEVYNILGQLVLSIPNANGVDKVDVSNLNAGTYFLKVSSDKGTSNSKFIKN